MCSMAKVTSWFLHSGGSFTEQRYQAKGSRALPAGFSKRPGTVFRRQASGGAAGDWAGAGARDAASSHVAAGMRQQERTPFVIAERRSLSIRLRAVREAEGVRAGIAPARESDATGRGL